MASREEFLTNKIFMNAVLPLLKVIVADTPSLANKFKAVSTQAALLLDELKAYDIPESLKTQIEALSAAAK